MNAAAYDAQAPQVRQWRRGGASFGALVGLFYATVASDGLSRVWLFGTAFYAGDLLAVKFHVEAAKRRQVPLARELVRAIDVGCVVGSVIGYATVALGPRDPWATALFGLVAGGQLGLRWWQVRHRRTIADLEALPDPEGVAWRRHDLAEFGLTFELPVGWQPRCEHRPGGEGSLSCRVGTAFLSLHFGPSQEPVIGPPPKPYRVIRTRLIDGFPAVEAALFTGGSSSQKLAFCYQGYEFIWTFPLPRGSRSHPLWGRIMDSMRLA